MTNTTVPRIALAVNPASARGSGARRGRRASQLLSRAGVHVVDVSGDDVDSCRANIGRVRHEVDALVVVGGDGMVNLAINEIGELPLGLVPSGTGNDFARSLGIEHRSVDDAVARVLAALAAAPTPVDLLEVRHRGGTTRVAGALSVGFDALVNRIANTIRLPLGPLNYQLALLAAIFRYRAPRYRVAIDGGAPRALSAMLMTATLNPSIGGGIRIVPDASRTMGRMSVFEVVELSKARLMLLLPRLLNASHVGLPEVTITRARTLTVEIDQPIVGMGDGEEVGLPPFDVRVLPGALPMLI